MFLFIIMIFLFISILLISSNNIIKENKQLQKQECNDIQKELIYIQNKILAMDGYEFERFMGNLFQMDGYKVVVTPSSNDNGRDIELYKDGLKTFVECKHYSNSSVSSPMINKLVGSCTIFGADKAIFVTTSNYSKAAINLTKQSPIEVDRWYLDDIMCLCREIGTKKVIRVLN